MIRLSSTDRSALIRLASSLPAGDETRRAILAGIKMADDKYEALHKQMINKIKGIDGVKKDGTTPGSYKWKSPLDPDRPNPTYDDVEEALKDAGFKLVDSDPDGATWRHPDGVQANMGFDVGWQYLELGRD